MESVMDLLEFGVWVAVQPLTLHPGPDKVPFGSHVQVPPPENPSAHSTVISFQVTPLMELVVEWAMVFSVSVASQELGSQGTPVKLPGSVPLALHVQYSPPEYPALQVTFTWMPVSPLIESAGSWAVELATWVGMQEMGLQMSPIKTPGFRALAVHVQVPPP